MNAGDLRAALTTLGVDSKNFRVLALLPLVYVAWADGTVQLEERLAIMRIARRKGWLNHGGLPRLEAWLSHPPNPEELALGVRVLRTLAAQQRGIAAGLPEDTLKVLLENCRQVAAAAGGFFGFVDPVSTEENEALQHIADALGISDGATWQEILSNSEKSPFPPRMSPHSRLGILYDLSQDPLAVMAAAHLQHGDVVQLPVPGKTVCLISHPDHVQHVLVNNHRNYLRGRGQRGVGDILGASSLTIDGEEWQAIRRILNPAFHRKMIDTYVDLVVRKTKQMLTRWSEHAASHEPVEARHEMTRLTLNIMGAMLFSEDLGRDGDKLAQATGVLLRTVNERMMSAFRVPTNIPTPRNQQLRSALDVFDRVIEAKLRTRRARVAAEEPEQDLLGLLLQARDPDTGDGLTDTQIRNELLTFLVAGHDTTAAGLTWTLCMASRHPFPASRVAQQIRDHLGERDPTPYDLHQCDQLTQFIDEVLRLYPPIPAFGRRAVSEDQIGGYTIRRETLMLVSAWLTHRRPDVWPNPEGFDPSRFAPDKVKHRPPGAYFPFALGPHTCIGRAFALMEMRAVMQLIFQRFDVSLQLGTRLTSDVAVTLQPKDPIWLQLTPRDDSA